MQFSDNILFHIITAELDNISNKLFVGLND